MGLGTAFFVCLFGFVCLRVSVCKQWGTDAERCVLISFMTLDSSSNHVGLPWCHTCATVEHSTQNNSVERSKWLVYSLHISPLCISVRVTLLLSLNLLLTGCVRWTENFKIQFVRLFPYLIGPLQSPRCGCMAKNVLVVQQFLWIGIQKKHACRCVSTLNITIMLHSLDI